VRNTTSEVRIEIEGPASQCERFARELPTAIPAPGRIDRTAAHDLVPLNETEFRIEASLENDRSVTPIPPDVAVCKECVRDLFDPSNPRYLYPFTTCTLCGPRFTVVRSFPYDRERTSMADFTMCPRCRKEYETPADRRFHSQTNSCPVCGPRLSLIDASGQILDGDPILESVRLLNEGRIVAVKGIGGFHLACDALNEDAVALLRERKGREEKPFAMMMPDMDTLRRFCIAGEAEVRLLSSAVAPIVLLPASGEQLASNVAPTLAMIGVMLPYAPIHHLLFRHPAIPVEDRLTALVMTSGNRSEEPIARGNREAVERLGDLVDALLLHDREIVLRADDSVFRVIGSVPTVFRRSRGLVPGGFAWQDNASPDAADCRSFEESSSAAGLPGTGSGTVVLGAGGDLKNALVIIKGEQVVPGPHVGDLGSPVAQEYFKQSAQVLAGYLEAAPDLIAADPHPEYFSRSLSAEFGTPVVEVFHHHAHAVSLLFEHGLRGPALFAVFDGTGYGQDGTIWGGEFLLADRTSFERRGHMGHFPLPGGEAAIREPVRILAALLASRESASLPEHFLALMGPYADRVRIWLEAVAKGVNSPVTSSAGRLFDAAAAAAGFCRQVTFEGQAAMWLEGIADPAESASYPFELSNDDPIVADPASLIREAALDMIETSDASRVSARFHNSVAHIVCEALVRLARKTGINTVGLTGGCFQNNLLAVRTRDLLQARGLKVLLHSYVPPNDGGLAIGQAVCARLLYEQPVHGDRRE